MSVRTKDTSPYQQPVREVLDGLRTDPHLGLSEQEASTRLERFGQNELAPARKVPEWRKFLAEFQNPLVILLLVATAISAGVWLYEREAAAPYEAIAILAVVLLNAGMGYIQEARAESALAALKNMAAARSHVIRDGVRRSVPASEIVPGDIILIEEGDTIPADARVIQSASLKTAEAALTGESLPVSKDPAPIEVDVALGDRDNMLFSGTAAAYGRARAVVVATGMNTEMGVIAGMLRQAPEPATPLQKELARVGKILGQIVIAIAVVMIVTIILSEHVRGWSGILDILIFGIALAVAAVPEGLPAVVTAVLSLGVQRMSKCRAIMRGLAAVETLGSASVIASDKTGTLTKNEMTVRTVVTAHGRVKLEGTGYNPTGAVEKEDGGPVEGLLGAELMRAVTVADRANNAVLQQVGERWTVQGDPTEGALIVAARKAGFASDELEQRFKRIGEVPFSSERKLMSTVHTDAEQQERLLVFAKGAPDVLLMRCSDEFTGEDTRRLTDERRKQIGAVNEELAGRGLRTLGVAYRSVPAASLEADDIDERVERELVFAGLVGMIDPPREEARGAVARAKGAGIRPIMITGDHPVTAAVIARELGIANDSRVVSGAELEQSSDDSLTETVKEVSVYARVNPGHKLRIVKALQRDGAVVAMTGDGVNDAPALKTADIGVAMGITGTDVAKEAADMVLADDNFATIVAAVEEGRSIFSNIRKFLRFLLSSNMGEVLTMFLGVLLAKVIGLSMKEGEVVLPLLATQLLWINLVTDGAPALALGVDPPNDALMNRPPRAAGERVITRTMWRGIFFAAVVMAAGTLAVFDASLPGGLIEGTGTTAYARTMAFTTLMVFQLFNVFNARSEERSAFEGLFTNLWLWASIGLAVVLQIVVVYVPVLQQAFSTTTLTLSDWTLCTVVASSVLWLREITKLIRRTLTSR